MPTTPHQLKIDTACLVRFVAFGVAMRFANILPYLLTRGAFKTDGLEIAGFPLRFYELGGIDGHRWFDPWAMAGNITIAVMASGISTWVFREGILKTLQKTLQKFRTWGTPYAE